MGLLTKLKRPKVFIPVLMAIIIVVIIVMAVRTLNSPAEGTVTTQISDTTAGQPKNNTIDTFSDSVISFKYPAIYNAQPGQKNNGYLDVVELRKTQQRTEFASIGVYPGTAADDSGVNYRQRHPDLYKIIQDRDGSIVFAKTDSKEYTGFLQKGPNVVTISFTSVGVHDFADDYKTVADSLTLKQ